MNEQPKIDSPQISSGRLWRLLALVLLGCMGLAAMLLLPIKSRQGYGPALHLSTFLTDGRGLENGAEVRIAGIRVGRVTNIRVRPEMSPASVEVKMAIEPGYRDSVPADSKVRLGKAGLLGATVVDIDIQFAKGAAASEGHVLLAD